MSNCIHRGLNLFFLSASLILSIGLLTAACGGGGGDGDGETPAADETSADGEVPSDGADGSEPISFDLSIGDNFFETTEFTISPGQKVTFNLTNDGQAIHNMHVAGPDNEYDLDFCEQGGEEPCSDPELFQSGDTGTLVWTAPDEPGEIIFRCDFHPLEMVGTISLE